MGRLGDALVGGWNVTGLFHCRPGCPSAFFPANGWPTNYDLTGEAVEIGNPGKVGVHRDALGDPTIFANSKVAIAAFRQLWFAKMSSLARSRRISNIQAEVHWWGLRR